MDPSSLALWPRRPRSCLGGRDVSAFSSRDFSKPCYLSNRPRQCAVFSCTQPGEFKRLRGRGLLEMAAACPLATELFTRPARPKKKKPQPSTVALSWDGRTVAQTHLDPVNLVRHDLGNAFSRTEAIAFCEQHAGGRKAAPRHPSREGRLPREPLTQCDLTPERQSRRPWLYQTPHNHAERGGSQQLTA